MIEMSPFYTPVCNITGASGVTIYPAIPAANQCYSGVCNSGYDNSNIWQGYGPNAPVSLQYGVPSTGFIPCLSSGYAGCKDGLSYSWDGSGSLRTWSAWYINYYEPVPGCMPGMAPGYTLVAFNSYWLTSCGGNSLSFWFWWSNRNNPGAYLQPNPPLGVTEVSYWHISGGRL